MSSNGSYSIIVVWEKNGSICYKEQNSLRDKIYLHE